MEYFFENHIYDAYGWLIEVNKVEYSVIVVDSLFLFFALNDPKLLN